MKRNHNLLKYIHNLRANWYILKDSRTEALKLNTCKCILKLQATSMIRRKPWAKIFRSNPHPVLLVRICFSNLKKKYCIGSDFSFSHYVAMYKWVL